MSLDFTNPKAVLTALHEATREALGVEVDIDSLREIANVILKKKHKDIYEARIRHLSPAKMKEFIAMIDTPYEELVKVEPVSEEDVDGRRQEASTPENEEVSEVQGKVEDTDFREEDYLEPKRNKRKAKKNHGAVHKGEA